MDSIEKIIGIILILFIILILSFIISDISKSVFYSSGGFRKFLFNKIRNFFS
jgi:hypothetical protein